MSVMVIVNFEAAEGKAEALLPLLQQGQAVSRTSEGCESFEVYQRQDDPRKFVLLERWTSLEDHHANMRHNIVETGHLAKLLPLLNGPIDNGVIQPVS
jgi:quinol monooxygenase YgiN